MRVNVCILVLTVFALIVVRGFQSLAFGQCDEHNYNWVAASGNWSNPDNWRHQEWDPDLEQCVPVPGVPGLGYTAKIYNGGIATISGAANVRLTFVQGSSILSLVSGSLAITDGLQLDWDALFEQSAGQASARYENVGSYGTGAVIQTGGTNTIHETLQISHTPGSNGTYELSGDAELSARWESVGLSGTGTFIHTGGTNNIQDNLAIGSFVGSNGTYELSGDGELLASGESIGIQGTGMFTQTGASHHIIEEGLTLGFGVGGYGIYNLSDSARLSTDWTSVGCAGSGTFIQTGGTNTARDYLALGLDAGSDSKGRYELSGDSQLQVAALTVGYEGEGTFIQTGGTNTIRGGNNCLVVGHHIGSVGLYELSNGTITADIFYVGCAGKGTFHQTGGHVTVDDLLVGRNPTGEGLYGEGVYELHGGTIDVGDEVSVGEEGTASFIMDGGTINGTTADADIEVVGDTGSLTGPGTFNIEVCYKSEEVYGTNNEESVEIIFERNSLTVGGVYNVTQITPADFAGGQTCCVLPSSVFEVSFTGQYSDEFMIGIPYDEAEVTALDVNEKGLTILRETGPGTFEQLPIVFIDMDDDVVFARSNSFGKFALASCFVDVIRTWQGASSELLGEPRCGAEIPDEALDNLSAWCITDDVNCPPPEPKHNQCWIRDKGCTLASATMIANSLLGTNFTLDKLNTAPLYSDEWFDVLPSGIFYNRVPWSLICTDPDICRIKTNDVYWPYVAQFVVSKGTFVHARRELFNFWANDAPKKEKIAEILCTKRVPVAVRLHNLVKGGHTVVAYDIEYLLGDLKIKIRDPSNRDQPPNGPEYLSDYYSDHAYSIVHADYLSSKTSASLYASLGCPGELLITDSNGRRTGYDPRTDEAYNEIPGVGYTVEWPNEDINDPCSQLILERSQLRKSAYIDVPSGETLNFDVIGTDDGQGQFVLESMCATGEMKVLVQHPVELEPNSVESIYVELHGPGDFDLDDDVDSVDLGIFSTEWLQTGDGLAADIWPTGGNDIVDLFDFAEFAKNWHEGVGEQTKTSANLSGDLDIKDLALSAVSWLSSTHPDCD